MPNLCIFSDASIYNDKQYGKFIGCAGAIAVQINGPVDICAFNSILEENYQIVDNTTVNRCELHGIYLALQMQNKYKNIYDRIDIYSDSALSVKGIRDWIFGWNRSPYNYFANSSDEYVKNQDMFKYIAYYIIDNNLALNLHHIRGHIDFNNQSAIRGAIDSFKVNNNGERIDKDSIKSMCFYNDMVDNKSRQYLYCFLNDSVPIYYNVSYPKYENGKISKQDLRKYRSLVYNNSTEG